MRLQLTPVCTLAVLACGAPPPNGQDSDTGADAETDLVDEDGDGVPASEDCNDADSTRWIWGPNGGHLDLNTNSVGLFCDHYCSAGWVDRLWIRDTGVSAGKNCTRIRTGSFLRRLFRLF